jgi:iron complex outermembrane recepter protein
LNPNTTVTRAVFAVLSSAAAMFTSAHAAGSTNSAASASDATLEEVIVTAQRKTESLQNVPIAVSVLTGETLAQLSVTNFEDYAKYIPNVTASTQTPGIGQIYIRGLATTQDGSQSSGATGPFPNVAVYLDDQSAQLPGRNLDVYAADLERIEILEGPQGTLFGAGAQAGVVRYITNKPQLDRDEGSGEASFGTTSHGDDNASAQGMLNLALVPDKFAVRVVAYTENRGGYINNVLGTFTRHASDGGGQGSFFSLTGAALTGSPVINNSLEAKDAFNPVTYKGVRLSELFKINDDWTVLLQESRQTIEADGLFTQEPFTPDSTGGSIVRNPPRSVVSFTPNYNKDKFTDIAWTIDGKIGDMKAVYTGGYLDRNIEQVADYTNYARSLYGPFYTCPYSYSGGHDYSMPCSSPRSSFQVIEQNTHLSHEFRLSTPDDRRIRATVGAFTEKYTIGDYSAWDYITLPNPVQLVTPANVGAFFVGTSAPGVGFVDNIKRGYNQTAGFGSLDFDLVPKVLTLTAGTRYFKEDAFQSGVHGHEHGLTGPQFGYLCATAAPCYFDLGSAASVAAGNVQNEKTSFSGFRNRFNLTWHVTDDAMIYATVSQGFRPGGFNRGAGLAPSSAVANGYAIPLTFAPDTLTNYEAGWKTQWLNHRLQVNGTLYEERWNNVQEDFFNPAVFGNLTFTTNGPNYTVKGAAVDVTARPVRSLTLQLAGAYNDAKETKTVNISGANGPIDWAHFGLSNPFGQVGDSLANSPRLSVSGRVRYDFDMSTYKAFVQVAGNYRSSSYASTDHLTKDQDGNSIAYLDPGYGLMDFSIGAEKDSWHAELYVANAFDRNAVTFQQATQRILQQSITRPRTIALRIGYRFGEHAK